MKLAILSLLLLSATAHAEHCELTDIGTEVCYDDGDERGASQTAVTPFSLSDGGYSTMICDNSALAGTPQSCEQVENACDIED